MSFVRFDIFIDKPNSKVEQCSDILVFLDYNESLDTHYFSA